MFENMRCACYKCEHRGSLTESAHSSCKNRKAKVEGDPHGIKNDWFNWPYQFDPVWLLKCDGFKGKEGLQFK